MRAIAVLPLKLLEHRALRREHWTGSHETESKP